MRKTSFFVSLSTSEHFDEKAYMEQAVVMANVFNSIFTDADKIAVLTKKVQLSSCHTEVEVSHSEGGLLGRAVVDFESEARVGLDKTKLSQMLKSAGTWADMKVEKRLVPLEGLEPEGDLVPSLAVEA